MPSASIETASVVAGALLSDHTVLIGIITASASFLGATIAQILSHHFALKREKSLIKNKTIGYINHITFDLALANNELSHYLRGVGVQGDNRKFIWKGTHDFGNEYINLSEKLSFEFSVPGQFILNTKKFFSNFRTETKRYADLPIGTELTFMRVATTNRLYLLSLKYIWGSYQAYLKPGKNKHKKGFQLTAPTYDEVIEAYSVINFTLPDRNIYEAAIAIENELEIRLSQLQSTNDIVEHGASRSATATKAAIDEQASDGKIDAGEG